MILRDRDRTVDPCCDNVVGLVFGDLWPAIIFILCFVYFDHNGGSALTRVYEMTKIVNKDNRLEWFYQTTKYKAGILPLNVYQTAVHRGERLELAPVERVEVEFSKEEGREGAPTSSAQETINSPNTMTTLPTTTLMILQWRKMVPCHS